MTDPGTVPVVGVPTDRSESPPAAPIGERVKQFTFGPSALVTPANGITLARLLATPVVVVMVAMHGAGWVPFAVAFTIGATDGIDGWLARRQGTTRSGAFLDPLADKAVVLSLLFVLAAKSEFSWLPVALIAGREVGMSAYRAVAGRRGISIPARTSAKVKTLVQGIAILLALAPTVVPHRTVLTVAVWVAVALTLATGAQYLQDGRRAAQAHGAA
ncbi:MAG TPA: CDP-alcohol phosphatidyltransferase family protein [Acidimicrobiales bacterium]|nr:CDP-alcohol phosphatidyltransferase family protein [Acidimicrobiales bacterium]